MEYSDAALDALRLEGDPLADGVITEIVAAGQIGVVNRLLRAWQEDDQPIPADLPQPVQEYLRATVDPPAWIDPQRIARAHDFFLDDGMYLAAVLSLGSMVNCYAVHRGAKLLDLTHRLNYPRRRMTETAQFFIYLMGEDAFGLQSGFVPTLQKVRLLHAAVRYHLRERQVWPEAEAGVPICQEDLLGALMLFSVQVLDGLERLGVHVTAQEAEDYYYVWRVAGAMLGIRADIMPESIAECHTLVTILKRRHVAASPEGRELTRDLLAFYQGMVPGTIMDGAVPALVRRVVDKDVADMLEVPHSAWEHVTGVLEGVTRVLEGVEDHNVVVRRVLDRAGWALLQGQYRQFRGGLRVAYDIPPDLRAGWGMEPLTPPAASSGSGCPVAH